MTIIILFDGRQIHCSQIEVSTDRKNLIAELDNGDYELVPLSDIIKILSRVKATK